MQKSDSKSEPNATISDTDAEIAAAKAKLAEHRAKMKTGHNNRTEQLRVAGEAARKSAMGKFDETAAKRAAEAQGGVDEANEQLRQSVEAGKKRFPEL